MRQALAEMSGKEAAALEAANEASWETRLHKQHVETLELRNRATLDAAELAAQRRCSVQIAEQETQLADLRREVHHWRSLASKRGGDFATLRQRRGTAMAHFVQRSLSQATVCILQAVFDRWADGVFRKDQLELWSMHVMYLHKQSETATRLQNKMRWRYSSIVDGLLRKATSHHIH